MGKLNLKIRDDVEAKFRGEVFKRKGMKKGNLTQAVEEAMLMWATPVSESKEESKINKENNKA